MKALPLFAVLLFAGSVVFAADALPSPWKQQDLGAAEVAGSASADNGVFTLQGTMDIWGAADGGHVVSQPLHGDGEIIARVNSVENTASHAKGSVFIRESLEPGARHATLAVTPADGAQFLSRVEANGVSTSQVTGKDHGRFPCWLKVVRRGKEFTGYESGDGENWTQVGKIELEIGPDAVAGLSATSHVKTTLCKAVFDNVKIGASGAAAKAASLPAPWKDQDIGEASKTPGSASFESGVFTLQGCMNILDVADGCHMVWQPLHGDGELVARVNSIENTAFHAKASIGIRESLEAGARHATMAVTPSDGALFLMRLEANGKTTSSNTGKDKGRFPCWLKVVRHGKEFTGYESGDGKNWTQVGQTELEIGPDAVVGLCTSSHVKTKLAKATFDNVELTAGQAPVK